MDQLIERHGEPTFANIDVEGFEAEALSGLSRPLRALSFEFTTILRQVAVDCVTRCKALDGYLFNAALGETQRFIFTKWVDAEDTERWLRALPDSANSGDIYARLQLSPFPQRNSQIPDRLAECPAFLGETRQCPTPPQRMAIRQLDDVL